MNTKTVESVRTMNPRLAEILRRRTPGERMRSALEANELVRSMIMGTLRARHPEWNDARLRKELIRRVLGDAARIIEARF